MKAWNEKRKGEQQTEVNIVRDLKKRQEKKKNKTKNAESHALDFESVLTSMVTQSEQNESSKVFKRLNKGTIKHEKKLGK